MRGVISVSESHHVPKVLFLHALGASASEWGGVIAALGSEYDCVALDLPGFGGAPDLALDIAGLVSWFAEQVAPYRHEAWAVVGHSMGGKIATLAVARSRDGDAAFANLAAVVLVAASPPSPEPIADDRREAMIGWFDDGRIDAQEASKFVDDNTASRLPDVVRHRALADVERSGKNAWIAWLETCSREDWACRAGIIGIPALIVAGGEDGDLGAAAQRKLNLPHYSDSKVEVIAGAGHLIPLEKPHELAKLIAGHVAPAFARGLPPAFTALLASDRVSARTRAVLSARHLAPPAGRSVLSGRRHQILAKLVEAVLPSVADADDLARRIGYMLGEGTGDGWRSADLPPDREAWALGLDTLDALSGEFAEAEPSEINTLLHTVVCGCWDKGQVEAALSPRQLQMWFAEARGEIAKQWIALPTTMARIGYDGFAVGGDGIRKQGYEITVADTLEPWQRGAAA